MRTILLMISIMLSSFSMPAMAADNAAVDSKTAKQIREALSTVPIVAIKSSVIPHLYELQVGNQIFYSDASGRYLMRGGHILDMQEQKDLTQQRLEDINRVDWSSLPLDKAIISGDTKAKKSIAIFTDPECPYCKGLEKTLKDVKGIKVYTFLFPLTSIHPNARAKAEGIWCSKDQHKMLQRVMLENFVPKATTCDTPIDAIAKVAARLNIHGTPAIIADDGRRMSGAPRTAEALTDWIANK